MYRDGKTLYQTCRKKAGITQEMAAEALNVSIESIGAYERGETPVPCDIVVKMASVYDDQSLAIRHMTEVCIIGKQIFNGVRIQDLQTSLLSLQKEMDDVERLRMPIISSVLSGTISTLQGAQQELVELVSAGMSFLISMKASGHDRQKSLRTAITKRKTPSVAPDGALMEKPRLTVRV